MKKTLISLGTMVIVTVSCARSHNLISVGEEINRLRGMTLEYDNLLFEARELKKIGQHAASSAVMATANSKLKAIQFTYESILKDYKFATFGWIERHRFEKDPEWEFIRESLKD
jgi:hypothetical protein